MRWTLTIIPATGSVIAEPETTARGYDRPAISDTDDRVKELSSLVLSKFHEKVCQVAD